MPAPNVLNIADAPEVVFGGDGPWAQSYQILTPIMADLTGARLGVNVTRLQSGQTACPFHTHQREDEVFFVLSGRGVLRYGDELQPIRQGDCITCPAGTGKAHQIANPFEEELVYLAIGLNDPDEVCTYPDNGKVLVRSIRSVGFLEKADYMAGEPARPRIFDLIEAQGLGGDT